MEREVKMKMGTTSMCCCVLLMLLSANLMLCSYWVAAEEQEREALEIITGGGYGPAPSLPSPPPKPGCPTPSPPPPPPPKPECAPPPPPPPKPVCPTPSPPPKQKAHKLKRAGKALVNFTRFIDDPSGYTRNWKSTRDICKYNGVRCAIYPGTKERAVAGIDLNGAKISGLNRTDVSLKGVLDRIPELTYFHVNSNNFTGGIPDDIIKYPYFYELDLSNNKIGGEFPNQVLQSKQLVFLDLRFNRLRGPIPPQLFESNLDVIFINNNVFTGSLPDNFGRTPARYLTFANNNLTGPIPSSIGLASKTLTEVLFLGNSFEGCLPFEIGYLENAVVFDVSRNRLTGPIPLSFACLESIRYLNLEHNQFYGAIPEMVCRLPGLRNKGNLSLADNYFTQVGPACRKLIMDNVLDLTNNCILGLPNQRPNQHCSQFFSKVKPCPKPKDLNQIPCKKYYYSRSQRHTNTTVAAASPPPPHPPLTYNALKPHRL